jgi:hypothetical protein
VEGIRQSSTKKIPNYTANIEPNTQYQEFDRNVHANNNFEMKNSTHTGTSNEHSKRLLKGANMEYKVQVDITK